MNRELLNEPFLTTLRIGVGQKVPWGAAIMFGDDFASPNERRADRGKDVRVNALVLRTGVGDLLFEGAGAGD